MPYGSTITASAEFTRPANTTAYAAKDVVGPATDAVQTFSAITRTSGGTGYVVGVKIVTDENGLTPTLRVHLYDTAPTAVADNAAWTGPLYADRAAYVGFVDVGPLTSGGSGADSSYGVTECQLPYDQASDALYGVIETRDAFTPASGQKFRVEVVTENN